MIEIDYTPIRRKVYRTRGISTEIYYRATCSCGFAWEVRKSSAAKIKQCLHCARSKAGRKGYETTCARYGPEFAYSTVQRSKAEVIVEGWLKELGIDYIACYPFRLDSGQRYVIDFIVDQKAIEIHGYWHEQTKAEKDAALRLEWPGEILFVRASEISKEQIVNFLS